MEYGFKSEFGDIAVTPVVWPLISRGKWWETSGLWGCPTCRHIHGVNFVRTVLVKWKFNKLYHICTDIYIYIMISVPVPCQRSWILLWLVSLFKAVQRLITPNCMRRLLSVHHRFQCPDQPRSDSKGVTGHVLVVVGFIPKSYGPQCGHCLFMLIDESC